MLFFLALQLLQPPGSGNVRGKIPSSAMLFNRLSRARILYSASFRPRHHSDRRVIDPPPPSSTPLYLISGTLLSTLTLAGLIFYSENHVLDSALERSKNSVRRIFDHMKQSAAAAGVLCKSLTSLLSSANQEVQKEFELRVAAFVADIVAANGARRSAIVAAGGGAVVDWLLETVARNGRQDYGTQAESARALAYLIADRNVCEAVLSRPRAIPNLLRFIFSFQPKKGKV